MFLPNDADVVMLLLYFVDVFYEMGVAELWVTVGKGECYCVSPTHSLLAKFEKQICKILLIVHILTGCDITSKIGTKQAALRCQFK